MKNIKDKIFNEVLVHKHATKNTKTYDVTSERSNKEIYYGDWHFFNLLMTNVELSEDDLEDMFKNLTDEEIEYWAEEIRLCGMDIKIAGNKAGSLARFYTENPIVV